MGKEEVYNLLKTTKKKMSAAEIAKVINRDSGTVRHNLTGLVIRGKIKYETSSRTRVYYVEDDLK